MSPREVTGNREVKYCGDREVKDCCEARTERNYKIEESDNFLHKSQQPRL
jgi:hypothetical protein